MDFLSQTPPDEPVFVADLRAALPGLDVQWLAEVDSTSSELRRQLESGQLRSPVLLLTDWQRGGRGTRGRDWVQPETRTGLDMAMTLAAPLNAALLAEPRLSLLCGAGLALALETVCNLSLGLKWPNDLLVMHSGWRKCGGLLLETLPVQDARWLLCGLGLNINSTAADYPASLRGRLATLSDAAGGALNRGAVHLAAAQALAGLLLPDSLEPDSSALLASWQVRDQTKPLRYILLRDGRRVPVTAEGVDPASGGLRVRLPGGAVTLVQSYTELEAV